MALAPAANRTLLVLQLKALRAGKALVRVSLSRAEHLDHYISVRISNAIVPLAPVVHAGGRVQFAMTFATRMRRPAAGARATTAS